MIGHYRDDSPQHERITCPMTKTWTLMATHGAVLFYIASNPDSTMRQMSEALGFTERRIAQVVKDLAEADMIVVGKEGRRNSYSVNLDAHFRHPTLSHVKLKRFVEALSGPPQPSK
jgi:DNA-binding transcriptional regulator GbsR (MarR family)